MVARALRSVSYKLEDLPAPERPAVGQPTSSMQGWQAFISGASSPGQGAINVRI
jgi:hypothetical protein